MKLRIDSPFIQTGIKLTNLLILNLFWVIGCIPIVTIGVSTIAAFTVTLKMTEGREGLSMTIQFWSAFVKNLKHGIPLTLLLLAGIWSVWVDWQIFDKIEGNPIGFLILALAVIFLLLVHFLYVFPLEARYENRLLMNLSNARELFTPRWKRPAVRRKNLKSPAICIKMKNMSPLRELTINNDEMRLRHEICNRQQFPAVPPPGGNPAHRALGPGFPAGTSHHAVQVFRQ